MLTILTIPGVEQVSLRLSAKTYGGQVLAVSRLVCSMLKTIAIRISEVIMKVAQEECWARLIVGKGSLKFRILYLLCHNS